MIKFYPHHILFFYFLGFNTNNNNNRNDEELRIKITPTSKDNIFQISRPSFDENKSPIIEELKLEVRLDLTFCVSS